MNDTMKVPADLQEMVSQHFRWAEVVFSETAERDQIPNIPPDALVPGIIAHAKTMDQARELVGVAISPNSWYRGSTLERVICDKSYRAWCARTGRAVDDKSWAIYLAAKSHPLGRATDFNARKYGPPRKVFDAIRASGIVYDQLIIEFDSWVHMSTSDTPRMDAFGIKASGRYEV